MIGVYLAKTRVRLMPLGSLGKDNDSKSLILNHMQPCTDSLYIAIVITTFIIACASVNNLRCSI